MIATSEPSLTVLIVEDEQAIRRFVRAALEGEGYRVHEADTLRGGLSEAGTRKPDLVVLDLGLPDGDGVDFIRDLRAWSGIAGAGAGGVPAPRARAGRYRHYQLRRGERGFGTPASDARRSGDPYHPD